MVYRSRALRACARSPPAGSDPPPPAPWAGGHQQILILQVRGLANRGKKSRVYEKGQRPLITILTP